ncbi:MAG: Ig-like domain-containing protein [Gemmatimonadota bacterium]
MKLMPRAALVTALALLGAAGTLSAQQTSEAALRVTSIRVEPANLNVEAFQEATLRLVAVDAQGNAVDVPIRLTGARSAVRVSPGEGGSYVVTGLAAGNWELAASVPLPQDADREPVTLTIPVNVRWPAIARISVEAEADRLYAGTTVRHTAKAFHANGSERPGAQIQWRSSNPAVATVDRFGNVTAVAPGQVTITASLEQGRQDTSYTVSAFPATQLEVDVSAERLRTGDVIDVSATARNASGSPVAGIPTTWSYTFVPDDTIKAPGASGYIQDGKFVAEEPGLYTIIANAGPLSARRTVDVRPREAVRDIDFTGHGSITHVHTSDLWVFPGADGGDYAVTGTWNGDGWAYFWDVTDPANIVLMDSLQVDARTVNDVKASPSGRYVALSREGASTRANGPVLVDMSNPRQPRIAGYVEEGITGGVHNMFATEDYLFALSGGDKYVIIDVRDLDNPRYVSEYNHPDSRLHDVWVNDGIAYSSEWGTGVVIVDVGNGKWGGSIENPVFVKAVPYPVGRTHAAFPYYSESAGKFYLFLGDEIMARPGAAWRGDYLNGVPTQGGTPSAYSGYIHIIDWTDPENPKDVARYEVDEFGTHNSWVEDDILFQGYYEGGVRMVDVSGELLGDLYNQGREIAVFKSYDPAGFAANSAMVWGAQPYKGHIFFSDFNSGLWSVKLAPRPRDVM